MRRGSASPYSGDQALQELQRRVAELERALLPAQQARVLDRVKHPQRERFDQVGRGIFPLHHEMDLFPQNRHDHHVLLCPDPIELVEAYWIPNDDWTGSAVNYSWIRIVERRKEDSYADAKARELAYISGEPVSAGPHATGNLTAGQVYRFRLSQSPFAERSSVITIFSMSTTVPGVWPDGYVLGNYRYRTRGAA